MRKVPPLLTASCTAIYGAIFALMFSGASMAHDAATHKKGIQITDHVISIDDGQFTVKREAKLDIGKPNQYYSYTDFIVLSAWDGQVLKRCRAEVIHGFDKNGDDNWETETTKSNEDCKYPVGTVEALQPAAELRLENGALFMGRRQLATEEFLRERMMEMTSGERDACMHDPEQTVLAGCHLVADDHALELGGTPLANEKHVLVPILVGQTGEAGEESAALWVSIGRQYWRP